MGKSRNTNSVRVCTHGAHLCNQKGGLRSPFFVERQHVCQGELADDVAVQRNNSPMFIACPRCFDKHLQHVVQLMISAMAGGIHGAAARPSIIDVQHVALAHLLRTKKGSPVPSSRMSRARPRGPAVPIGSSSYSGAMPAAVTHVMADMAQAPACVTNMGCRRSGSSWIYQGTKVCIHEPSTRPCLTCEQVIFTCSFSSHSLRKSIMTCGPCAEASEYMLEYV